MGLVRHRKLGSDVRQTASRRAAQRRLVRAVESLEARQLFATYSVTDLGTLGGSNATRDGAGINNNGQAVVTVELPADSSGGSDRRAAFYGPGALVDLGTFGGPDSYAGGINGAGHIAGTAQDSNGDVRAFFYNGSSKTNLGTLGGSFSVGSAVNDTDAVVGWAQLPGTFGGPEHAFLWQNGTMTDLGTLSTVGADNSRAYAINASGQIVGESATSTGDVHAFRRTGTSLSDLGVLSGDVFSTARGNNDSGQIVGRSGSRAFLFDGATMTSLGRLSGDQYSQANDINNSGTIVGFSSNNVDLDDQRAVVVNGGTMTDLNTLIDPGSGWVLQEAYSINDSGSIVGVGTLNGNLRAFLLSNGSGGGGDGASPSAAITQPAVNNGDPTLTVTVTYSDNVAVSAATIDVNDIQVARQGGGALTVQSASASPSSDAASIVVTYTLAAPGGTWDGSDDGTYNVTVKSSQVSDTSGSFVPTVSTSFAVNLSASSGPTASIGSLPAITTAGATTGSVSVTYADADGVSVASIDTNDITITGGARTLAITGVTTSPGTDAASVVATYTFAPPDGSWDAADNDAYTVSVAAGQVLDALGNAGASAFSTFDVDIPVILPTVDSNFNGGAPVDSGFVVEAVVADLLGRSYLVGHSGSVTDGTSVGIVRRLRADGSADPTFGSNGQFTSATGDAYYDVKIDPSGTSLVVAGTRGGDYLATRLNTKNGKVVGNFGSKGSAVVDAGGATDAAYAVAITPLGQIWLGGSSTAGLILSRLDTRGRSLQTVSAGTGTVSELAVRSDGAVIAAGDTGAGAVFVTRLAADGTADATFNGGSALTVSGLVARTDLGGPDRTIGLALQSDGAILVANRSTGGDFAVARLTSGGSADTSFSGDGIATVDFGGDDDADVVLVQASGQIALVGTTNAGGTVQTAVAMLDSAGNLIPTFDDDGKYTVASGVVNPPALVDGAAVFASATLQPDGRLLTATSSAVAASSAAVRRLNVPGFGSLGLFGNANGKNSKLTFVDGDGTLVTVTLKNATGTGQYDGTDINLVITGSNAASALTVKTKGGDGRARIGDISTDGSLKSIVAKTSDLRGTLFVNGSLAKSQFGTVSGTMAASANLGQLSFFGDVAGALVVSGTNLGADGSIGGGDDTYTAAVISKLTVTGAVAASVVAAGMDPVDGNYFNGGTIGGGAANAIGPITVKQVVDGVSRFFAGSFGKIKAPGKVDVASDPRFELLA